MSSSQTPEYQQGFSRGKKSADKALLDEVRELRRQVSALQDSQRERVYLSCLDTVLRNCSGWEIGGKPIKDAKGYCTLAKVFTDNSIEVIE